MAHCSFGFKPSKKVQSDMDVFLRSHYLIVKARSTSNTATEK
ncbi:hypothetical protein PJE062_322 [Pseudovibrio sp. JE062]|nr:hypothetical protein PJE062_322 [Pseudovibrio sp. JE062]